MKTRVEVLIDIITDNECRISDLKGEIMRLEEEINVARANLIELGKEEQNGKDL